MPPVQRPPLARHWCFTLNNPTIDEEEIIERLEQLGFIYTVFQLEVGEQGTPHYQGYVIWKEKQRLTAVTPLFAAHWSIARGTPEQNKAYCTKPESRLGDFCESGLFPETQPGKRTDLDKLHSRLKENERLSLQSYATEFFSLFARYPDLSERYYDATLPPRDPETPFRTWLLIGPPGTGKSRLSLHLAKLCGGGEPFRHSNIKWFDGYRGERTVIFDDFCGSSLSFSIFKRVLDRYPFRVELKGTTREMVATNFIITTNQEPSSWWKEEVTGSDKSAIFRRIGKVLWFRGLHKFSFYPDYATYARTVLTPRRDGEGEVETPIQEVHYEAQALLPPEVEEEVLQ